MVAEGYRLDDDQLKDLSDLFKNVYQNAIMEEGNKLAVEHEAQKNQNEQLKKQNSIL